MALKPFGPREQLQIASLGMEIALAEIAGVAVGWYLDKKLNTYPGCLLVGAVLGFALGMVRVVQVARQAGKKDIKNGRN